MDEISKYGGDQGVRFPNRLGKDMRHPLVCAYATLLVTMVLTSCGDAGFEPSDVVEVRITPDSITLNGLGETVALTAELVDREGNATPASPVRWASLAPSIAKVDSAGLVTALGSGEVFITAIVDGRRASVQLVVSLTTWEYEMEGQMSSCPVLDSDGTIYVSTDLGVYAINPDGTGKWRFMAGNEGNDAPSPALGPDGTVYALFLSTLYALRPDGSVKWEHSGAVTSRKGAPAVGSDGTVYLQPEGAGFLALDPYGNVKWSVLAGETGLGQVVIGPDRTIYGAGRRLYALEPDDGATRWVYEFDQEWLCAAPGVRSDGSIIVPMNNHLDDTSSLYAINSDGSLGWRIADFAGTHCTSPAVATDGTIYVHFAARLYAISPDGIIEWEFGVHQTALSSPAIGSDGNIYFGWDQNGNDVLYAFTPDGNPFWAYQTPGQAAATPTIGTDGMVYQGASFVDSNFLVNSRLFAVSTSSMGLADAQWPKYMRDLGNSGNSANR